MYVYIYIYINLKPIYIYIYIYINPKPFTLNQVDEDNQKKIKSLGAIPLITKLLTSRTPEVLSSSLLLSSLKLSDTKVYEP